IHQKPQHPTILWDITSYCNFKCTYCYSDHMPNRTLRLKDKYPLEYILKCFEMSFPGWAINFSGGEPFVYADFVEAVGLLTQNNSIGIYSNLSIEKQVDRFSHSIDPQNINFINCGFHVLERLKWDPDLKMFWRLHEKLSNAGFNIVVTYIVHPNNAPRAEEDMKMLLNNGIIPYLKVFRGSHHGKTYPEAFSAKILDLVEANEAAIGRGRSVKAQMTMEGNYCRAGMMFVEMDVGGNVFRCGTDRSLHRECMGNLFKSTLRLDTYPRLCQNRVCMSCRQGLGYGFEPMRNLN
ncbi:MAG: radical SAM protein, partial [Bacteroidota bacterium]